jgi:hypothetical protein
MRKQTSAGVVAIPPAMMRSGISILFALFTAVAVAAPVPTPAGSKAQPETEQDEYTQYELLAPESASFKIVYEVTAITPGAKSFWNPIRKGSVASDEAVFDVFTGAPLKFEQVNGATAKEHGLSDADLASDYIEVHLARPVPLNGGEARLQIVKTYKDPKTYRREGDVIVFDRPLFIRRNAIILPAGYWLLECNVPSQILSEPDGRTRISFMHQAPGPAALILKAKLGPPSPGAGSGAASPQTGDAAKPQPLTDKPSWEPPPTVGPTERDRLTERAHQDRDIIYFLQEPETHAFKLCHEYTESREGTDKYLNVVRSGSKVRDPSGKIVDTGELLKAEVLTGAKLKEANIDAGDEKVTPEQEVVVFRFPAAVKRDQSVRLQMCETYTAPESYGVAANELVFDRGLGRPRNAVVLPRNWHVTASSIPAVVTQTPDGLTELRFFNGRPDDIDVLIKARRSR